jgi:hypothetical protein
MRERSSSHQITNGFIRTTFQFRTRLPVFVAISEVQLYLMWVAEKCFLISVYCDLNPRAYQG